MKKEYFLHRAESTEKFDFWRYGEKLGKKLDDIEVREILENIDDSESSRAILDVGCGTGYHLKQISKKRKFTSFVGLDYTKTYIEKAKENFPRGIFITGSPDVIPNIEFNGSLDTVIMVGILQYLDENTSSRLSKSLAHMMNTGRIIIKHPVYFGKKGCKIETNREGFEYISYYKTFEETVGPFLKHFNVKLMKRLFEKSEFSTDEFRQIDSVDNTQQMLIVLDRK